MTYTFRDAVRAQVPDADPERLSELRMSDFCSDARANSTVCVDYANLGLMGLAGIGAGAVGLGLLLLIRSLGLVARNSRSLLAVLFRPALYLTGVVLIGLVLAHAALAMGSMWYAESALINRVHGGIVVVIGVGALIGAWAIARSVFAIIRKAQTLVIGASIARASAPELWRQAEEIARKLGALPPENIVIGLDANFFVTEADVITPSRRLSGRTLYCSLPLARILTRDEFLGVVGHELGHFKGADTKFSERFYPIYRGTQTALASLMPGEDEEAGSSYIAILPAIAIFGYFLECFAVAESRLSRERETRCGCSWC